MKNTKKFLALLCCVGCTAAVFAQRSQTSVEDEYLSSVEDVIITELAASDDYDNKLVALQYLEESIQNGRSTPEMVAALSSLAGEGVTTQARTNGRLMNNFPDIRARSCELLGKLPTEESKITLVMILKDDTEPMVVTAAVKSLGEIGINEDDEVVNVIEYVQQKYSVLNPTSSLALEVLSAYEKLAPTVKDKGPLIQSISSIATNYKYVKPVRDKALQLLRTLQQSK